MDTGTVRSLVYLSSRSVIRPTPIDIPAVEFFSFNGNGDKLCTA
jgi:hypothetical protein